MIIPAFSPHGISWFCSPLPAILWLGWTGKFYPNSHEVTPLVVAIVESELSRRYEGERLSVVIGLNPYYYKVDTSLDYLTL